MLHQGHFAMLAAPAVEGYLAPKVFLVKVSQLIRFSAVQSQHQEVTALVEQLRLKNVLLAFIAWEVQLTKHHAQQKQESTALLVQGPQLVLCVQLDPFALVELAIKPCARLWLVCTVHREHLVRLEVVVKSAITVLAEHLTRCLVQLLLDRIARAAALALLAPSAQLARFV
jgi:hypothetical protein